LDMQKAKYDNTQTFLQYTKVIMAKLKTCDWGSLDENLIQICVATLKRLLVTAISYDLEQTDPVIELMNHDTGTLIDDSIAKLSVILHDFKDSDQILPDSGLQLYGEYESFVKLSEGLRAYFEKNVQPRKDSSDDSKWFSNLNKFIKCIIERRVLRVKDWYLQNTAKFSHVTANKSAQKKSDMRMSIGVYLHVIIVEKLPYEEVHDLHHCKNETYPIQCPILDCQRKCQSNNHFHSNSQVDHFCGNEHQCHELYEETGICKVKLEPRKQEDVYDGLIKGTSITFTKCTLPYRHTQNHNTSHGNMILTEFTGEDYEFKYEGHKLRVGDQGTFVLCNLFCKDLGRHRHIDYCQSQDICQGQDIQHINEQIQPNPSIEKDFISHKLFWKRTEQQEFAKCDHECLDEIHHKSKGSTSKSTNKSFCELPLFHTQLDPESNPPHDNGYISKDRHHFNYENPSACEAAFHIIFVLNHSSSMGGSIQSNILKLWFRDNNMLDAVYNAVFQFMNACINSTNQVIRDKLSLILFNHKVIVPFENEDPTDLKKLLDAMIVHKPNSETCFESAIKKAGSLISFHYDPTRTNGIIFLSDGECVIPERQLHHVFEESQTRGFPLYLYTVLFSSNSSFSCLEEMAKIVQSYHNNYISSDSLQSQFTRAIDEIRLVNHFTDVVNNLREHKPTLLKKGPNS
ncbi:4778_t:CDS:10, partial [Funneliformis geosporum]